MQTKTGVQNVQQFCFRRQGATCSQPPWLAGLGFSFFEGGMSHEQREVHSRVSSHEAASSSSAPTSLLGRLTGAGLSENAVRTTKYTVWTFLPLELFEQFQRLFNLFWLAQCVIVLIPDMTPTNPISTILAFAFVIGLSVAKGGWEDHQRYKADREANSQKVEVLRDGEFRILESRSIRVGDVIHVKKEEQFPADMVLLSCEGMADMCYVETANLDGESNLKRVYPMPSTAKFDSAVRLAEGLRVKVSVEAPNERLYKFNGRLYHVGTPGAEAREGVVEAAGSRSEFEAISAENVCLRGARLRRTEQVHGLVVYAGMQTKLQMNARGAKSKFARLEVRLNRYIVYLFVVDIIICAGLTAGSLASSAQQDGLWYLGGARRPLGEEVSNFLTYFILLSAFIPLALMVSLELAILTQSLFMRWDNDMVCSKNKRMRPYTSSLNSELGLIEYVMCDKTGTLTQNKMEFRQCSVGGSVYHDPMSASLQPNASNPEVSLFLRLLAICNEVVPEEKEGSGQVEYASQSPDEVALVKGAAVNGTILMRRAPGTLTISHQGKEEVLTIISSLEFTPERRRMSVLVRSEGGDYLLLSKGADQAIQPQLAEGQLESGEAIRHLEEFAAQGHRVMMCSARSVPQQEAQEFLERKEAAGVELEGKDERVAEAYGMLEKGMTLVGVTCVEDKLQDDVPGTVQFLLAAGMHVWILTGDKLETAEAVARTSSIVSPTMTIAHVRAHDKNEVEQEMRAALDAAPGEGGGKVLVIDGMALTIAKQHFFKDFVLLCEACNVVICARCAPVQKAELVQLVMVHMRKVCLAVGDGGNDVPMIGTANVGVGIMGNEGMQASRASDFAIGEFRLLLRLIAVHGRYSSLRSSELIKYSFYKNLCFATPQIVFSFYSLFTGQSIANSWVGLSYNVFCTGMPALILAVFEKDLSEELIYRYPEAYSTAERRNCLTGGSLVYAELVGFYQGTLIAILALYSMDFLYDSSVPGRLASPGVDTIGMSWPQVVVVSVLGSLCMRTRTFNWIVWFFIFGSILATFLVIIILDDLFCPDPAEPVISCGVSITPTLTSLRPWLLLLVSVVAVLLPEGTFHYIQRNYFPSEWMKVQVVERRQGLAVMRSRFQVGGVGGRGFVEVVQVPSEDSSLRRAA